MCDVKTIEETAIRKKYRSNCNVELSPVEKYEKATLV